MREIRPSGSEGGAVQLNAPFLPLSSRTSNIEHRTRNAELRSLKWGSLWLASVVAEPLRLRRNGSRSASAVSRT